VKVERKEILNQDGLDVNDYRGSLDKILDLPEKEAKHLIGVGRTVAVSKPKKKTKKDPGMADK
jgi:hypothetical protein